MSRIIHSLRHTILALCAFSALAGLGGCGGGGSSSVLLTCGNGVVESGEECDDGGVCSGGPNAGARCQVGISAGDDTPCTSTAPCSLALGGGACRGPFQPETYLGAACSERSAATDCCPAGNPECGNVCVGQCMGGAANGDACSSDDECIRAGACVVDDSDSCTSICRFPVCGDGVVNRGLEQCDGFNLGANTCATEQLGAGTLRCTATCLLDSSACGPPFTPTATNTATSPPTETATPFPSGVATFTPTQTAVPTATPTVEGGVAVCGNDLLEVGENCREPENAPAPVIPVLVGDPDGSRCDQDCIASACTPSSGKLSVSLSVIPPPARQPTALTLLVAYRASQLLIPGAGGLNPAVRASVQLTSSSATFQANDREYGMRLVITDSSPLSDPTAFVTFDVCADAVDPSASDVSCIVEACAGAGASIEGCTCVVDAPTDE